MSCIASRAKSLGRYITTVTLSVSEISYSISQLKKLCSCLVNFALFGKILNFYFINGKPSVKLLTFFMFSQSTNYTSISNFGNF